MFTPEPACYLAAAYRIMLNKISFLSLLCMIISGLLNISSANNHSFPPGVPDLSNPLTRYEIIADYALANGVALNRIRVYIFDSEDNPVANEDVSFTINGGAGGVSNVVTTDVNGEAILLLNSIIPGPATITATVRGAPIVFLPDGNIVTFIAINPTVNVPTTFLEVTQNNAEADGTANNQVRAHITDVNGFPVPFQTVTFTIESGVGNFSSPVTVVTDMNGDAFVTLNSTTAGTVNVTATVNGVSIVNGSPAPVVFVADEPTVTVPTTFLTVTVASAPANGVATGTVEAHLTDANGNPVPNQEVVFSILNGDGTIVGSGTVTTNASGVAVIQVSSTVANTVTIGATVNGVSIINGSPAPVNFVADVPSVSTPDTYLAVVENGAVADGTDINSVVAHITDANGNPVANQAVVFTVTGNANVIGSTTVVTDANGNATITMSTTVAGSVNITATVNGVSIINGSPANVVFVADAPDASNTNTIITIINNNAPADGATNNTIQAHIVDANGNPVAGQTVTFVVESGDANPSGGSFTVTTDADGNATLDFNSTIPGNVVFTAILNGTTPINGGPLSFNFQAEPDLNHSDTYIEVVDNNALADGIATNSVRVKVVDANGNPLTKLEVYFAVDSGDATIITSPQPLITDANGEVMIYLTSTTVGYANIIARVENSPIVNGSPAKIRFTTEGIWVPKVFTPNGDGRNDIIRPIIAGNFTMLYFNVYNRWGNLVFSTRDPNQGWDGKIKGVLQPNETYLWMIGANDGSGLMVQRRGMFSLVR